MFIIVTLFFVLVIIFIIMILVFVFVVMLVLLFIFVMPMLSMFDDTTYRYREDYKEFCVPILLR